MKHELALTAITALFIVGITQPALAQDNMTAKNSSVEQPENQSQNPGSAFEMRLKVAINGLDALKSTAPDNNSKKSIENAIEELENIQNSSKTLEAEPENQTRDSEENTSRSEEPEIKQSENKSEQEKSPKSSPSEPQTSSENVEDSSEESKTGFVSTVLKGIFG